MTRDALSVSEVVPPEGGVYLRLDLRAGLQGVLIHQDEAAAVGLWRALGARLGLWKPLAVRAVEAARHSGEVS
ncbi:hypothetical protein VZ95_13770 [Elstera litoralis]|uniref:Uncharacterized protein n=1 Tax=Elstera litoralis TaxID=552518 RepID=A0A0F3IQR8_9PROT|nr:hypothetical protein [Elstera litoralis]KJV09070.1 hypothetical protein VZ95_13770 [Elstera litoralis]